MRSCHKLLTSGDDLFLFIGEPGSGKFLQNNPLRKLTWSYDYLLHEKLVVTGQSQWAWTHDS